MAKIRKTKSVRNIKNNVEVQVDNEVVKDSNEVIVDEVKVEPTLKVDKKKYFTAILKNASTLSIAGRRYVRNVPASVPIEHLNLFKKQGWFNIIM